MIRRQSTVTLESCLQDVETRFLLNLPETELQQSERLFFQIEQAWWYYEDFFADKYTDILPHYKTLKSFAEMIFVHCPLLSKISNKFNDLFNDFGEYKNEIPVCGCIMLSPDLSKIALICSWKGHSWSFPKGKLDQDESFYQCALRETFEETGYTVTSDQCSSDDVLVTVNESKITRLFIVKNVAEETNFVPQTRKEVSKVSFFLIDSLPKSTYGVIPLIPKLKRWINKYKKSTASPTRRKDMSSKGMTPSRVIKTSQKDSVTNKTPTRGAKASQKDNKTPTRTHINVTNSSAPNTGNRANSTGNKRNAGNGRSNSNSNSLSAQFDGRNKDTFASDSSKRWNVADMFAANSKLTGLSYVYDGNPHSFGSSHPRFVDYRTQGGNDVASTKNISTDAIATDATSSDAVNKWKKLNIFNLPFVLNKVAILSILDDELNKHSHSLSHLRLDAGGTDTATVDESDEDDGRSVLSDD